MKSSFWHIVRISFVLAIAGSCCLAVAQPVYQWVRYYDNGYAGRFVDVFAQRNGGFAMCGATGVPGNPHYQLWVVVTDDEGNEVLSRSYPNGLDTIYTEGYSIIQTDDGGHLIGGACYPRGEYLNFLVVKIDSAGEQEWWRTYGGDWGRCWAVIELKGGNYVAAGGIIDDHSLVYSYSVMLARNGDVIWEESYGRRSEFRSVREVEEGLLFAGERVGNGVPMLDGWLLRTDFDGEVIWSRSYEAGQIFWSLVSCREGGFAVAGEIFFQDGFTMMRVDHVGEPLWTRSYYGENDRPLGFYPVGMTRTADGGYLLVGNEEIGDQEWRGLLVKVDSEGEPEWERIDEQLPDSAYAWGYYSAVVDRLGYMVVAGEARYINREPNASDGVLLKVVPAVSAPVIINRTPEEYFLTVLRGDSVEFSVEVIDLQDDSLSYVWTVEADTVSADSAVTIVFDALGRFDVKCVVSDGGLADSTLWLVDVRELFISDFEPDSIRMTLLRDSEVEFHVDVEATEGEPVSYSWRLDRDPVSDSAGALIRFGEPGEHVVKAIASRGGFADSVAWQVRVFELFISDHRPPELDLVVRRTESVLFRIGITAAEGGPIDYIWKLDRDTVSRADTALIRFDLPGRRTVEAIASRGGYADSVAWQVLARSVLCECWPQEFELTVPQDTTIQFEVVPFYPGSDSLSFFWTYDDDSIGIDRRVTVAFPDTGLHQVTIFARDGCEADTLTWEVTVVSPEFAGGETDRLTPKTPQLYPPKPNPFNAMSTIRYFIPEPGTVKLNLYDLNGRLVKTLASGAVTAGYHKLELNATNLPAGLYLLNLLSGEVSITRKAVVVK